MPGPASPPAEPGVEQDGGGSSWESVVSSIGPKVHALRQRRGLSLQQLAQLADVSAAAVHKVERGDMVPTITTLLKIAAALRTPIGHFVEGGAEPGPLAVHRRGLQADPTAVGSTTISGPPGRFRAVGTVSRLAPGARRTGQRLPGEALVVVVHGSLAISVGEEDYTVAAGESLHFPTNVEHGWANPGPGIAQALWFTLTDG